MYCPKCGMDNREEEKICISCSAPLPVVPDLPPEISKTSKLAIWSFVLSILGLFTFMVTSLPALICGIIGLVKISNSNGRLRGKGYAIAGIVMPFVYFIFICILGMLMAIMMPALSKARHTAQRTVCMTNLKSLGVAISVYANDNGGEYPLIDNWCDLLKDKVRPEILLCPSFHKVDGQTSYALNINVAGKKSSEVPPDTVILFETTPAANPAGGPEILSIDNHVNKGSNALFADGHVEFVREENLQSLRWKPE